jgi:hypothetical protein
MVCATVRPMYSVMPGGGSATAGFVGVGATGSGAGGGVWAEEMRDAARSVTKKAAIFQESVGPNVMRIIQPMNAPRASLLTKN